MTLAVGESRKQTCRVAIGANPTEHDIKVWKSGDVFGEKLISRLVNGLSAVGRESVEVSRGNRDVIEERVSCLLIVSVNMAGRDESFVAPPDVNSSPINHRDRRGTTYHCESAYPNRAACDDYVGATAGFHSG
jgi:hypothetical protein